MKRLIARLEAGATLKETGSLTMRAPGGMMTKSFPAKVMGAAVPGVMALAPALRAIWAAPIVSGSRPNSLVRTIRMDGPPMEMWTISRRVVPSVPGAPNVPAGFFAAMGEVAQVPTQWSGDVAAVAGFGMQQRPSRQSGRKGDVLVFAVISFLRLIGFDALSYLCFSGADVDV
jgi:hypothetical protein